MGGNAVRSIVLLMVLVVLSFVIGAQISDSLRDSIGAFTLIGSIVMGFVMLMIGEKAVALMIVFPCIFYDFYFIPGMAGLRQLPLYFIFSGAIFAYCILMWVMRYVHLRWRGVLVLDVLAVLLTLYYIGNYITYPTSVLILADDAEYVGGREYFWLIAALLYYIAISSVSYSAEKLPKLLHYSFWICVYVHVGYLTVFGVTGELSALISAALSGVEARFSFFNYIVPLCLYYCYASAPIGRLISSARSVSILGICSFLLMLGGRREVFLATGLTVAFLAFLKKELFPIFVVLLFLYAGCLALSSQDVFMSAPHPVQRVMTLVPGIKVYPSIEQSTEGSSETRREIWRYGLDPRTGLIKDYIWGDGFQKSVADMERQSIANMRNMAGGGGLFRGEGQSHAFAREGLWHNGFLYTISHTGLLGLALVVCLFMTGMVMTCSVSLAYQGTRYYPAIMAFSLPWSALALSFAWGSSTLCDFFASWAFLGIIKIMYCAARETGRLHPLFVQRQYVPLMIRQAESRASAAGRAPGAVPVRLPF